MGAAEPLNIVLVVGRFAPDGGTGRQAWHLAGHLAQRHPVEVVCCEGEDRPGVSVRRVLPRGSGALGVWRRARAVRALRGFVVTLIRAPGAVHRAGGGAHAAWMAARGGMPRPVDLAEIAAERLALRNARVVLCNSDMAARDLEAAHGPGAYRVVRNGVDLERFRPDPAARAEVRAALGVSGRIALFAGHGFRRKGLDVAARAFAAVARAADRLVVVGHDAQARRLRDAARIAGGRLVALGPRPDPERFMAAADAVILPTRYDPSANSTLEALACDVPAVTSGRDGAAEIAPDRALVVDDPGDVAGFATALLRAWEDRGPVGRFRAAAEPWPASRMGSLVESMLQELFDG